MINKQSFEISCHAFFPSFIIIVRFVVQVVECRTENITVYLKSHLFWKYIHLHLQESRIR